VKYHASALSTASRNALVFFMPFADVKVFIWVHPTIWGDELKKADMLVTPGVVFSGTTFQRRVQHVHRLIVS
jgi:hypothetical protein